jgi:hypothetical protein
MSNRLGRRGPNAPIYKRKLTVFLVGPSTKRV